MPECLLQLGDMHVPDNEPDRLHAETENEAHQLNVREQHEASECTDRRKPRDERNLKSSLDIGVAFGASARARR